MRFPKHYGGRRRKFGVLNEDSEENAVPYGQLAQWELRSRDRQAAKDPTNLFTKLRLAQMRRVRSLANYHMRTRLVNKSTLPAKNMRDPDFLNKLTDKRVGYDGLKNPTFFTIFTCDDQNWPELLRMLSNMVDGKDLTDEGVAALTFQDRMRLTRSDWVTATRFYVNRIDTFSHDIMYKCRQVFGAKVLDYFHVDEMQKRGVHHRYGCMFVEGAPQYDAFDPAAATAVVAFIDKHISCRLEDLPNDLAHVQVHTHILPACPRQNLPLWGAMAADAEHHHTAAVRAGRHR